MDATNAVVLLMLEHFNFALAYELVIAHNYDQSSLIEAVIFHAQFRKGLEVQQSLSNEVISGRQRTRHRLILKL